MRATVPVTVLTGFLGAGKTTLINRILGEAHGRRFAVIENEFGEINVDAELLLQDRSETIVQLTNGCVCCTVRGDLANALAELANQREAGKISFDQVLVETTGVADPGPIARTFLAETELLAKFHLDGVVTLFDALHGERTLVQSVEAQAQLGYADRILITKADLVDEEALDSLTTKLIEMNANAQIAALDIAHAAWSEVFEKLLDIRGYQFDRVFFLTPSPRESGERVGERGTPQAKGALPGLGGPPLPSPLPHMRGGEGAHTPGLRSVSFTADTPLDGTRLNAVLAAFKTRYGEALWRLKGVVAIEGMRQRVILQGVQGLMQANPAGVWRPYEPRRTQLVIIGRDLDTDWMLSQLRACETAPAPA